MADLDPIGATPDYGVSANDSQSWEAQPSGGAADSAGRWQDAMQDAGLGDGSHPATSQDTSAPDGNVQLAQFPLPAPVPLPMPLGPMPTLPPSIERDLGQAIDRAGRRLDHVGEELRRGDLSGAAGHALLGRPFPPEVDDPSLRPQTMPMATTPPPQTDSVGRAISPRASAPPPGDCTPGEQQQLQRDVVNACKTVPLACRPSMSIADLALRGEQNQACAAARDRINSMCFAGGDANHREEAISAWKRAAQCRAYTS